MDDEAFWDCSLRFLFKQFDIFMEMNKQKGAGNKKSGTAITKEVKKYKVIG